MMLPIAALVLMPETVLKRRSFALELRLPAVPRTIRTQFAFASAVSFTVWAAAALYLTLAPSYVAMLLGLGSLAIGGAFVSLMLLASAGAQFLCCPGLAFRVAIAIGLALLPVGLRAHFAGPLHSPALLVTGTLVVGAGNRFGFLGTGARQQALAGNAARRSDVELLYRVLSRGRAAGSGHRLRGSDGGPPDGRHGLFGRRELIGAGAARNFATARFSLRLSAGARSRVRRDGRALLTSRRGRRHRHHKASLIAFLAKKRSSGVPK